VFVFVFLVSVFNGHFLSSFFFFFLLFSTTTTCCLFDCLYFKNAHLQASKIKRKHKHGFEGVVYGLSPRLGNNKTSLRRVTPSFSLTYTFLKHQLGFEGEHVNEKLSLLQTPQRRILYENCVRFHVMIAVNCSNFGILKYVAFLSERTKQHRNRGYCLSK